MLKSYLIIVLLTVTFLMVIGILDIDSHLDKMSEIIRDSEDDNGSRLAFIFSALILAPILEEYAFRHPLKDLEVNFLPSLVATFILFLLSQFYNPSIGILLIFYGTIITALWVMIRLNRKASQLSSSWLYLVSILFFVAAHYGNLRISDWNYWPVYVMFGIHMVVAAFFLAQIRLWLTTRYSIFLHFLYNLMPTIAFLN